MPRDASFLKTNKAENEHDLRSTSGIFTIIMTDNRPRGWRLLTLWGALLKPLGHHSEMVLLSVKGALNRVPTTPTHLSLLDGRTQSFQRWWLAELFLKFIFVSRQINQNMIVFTGFSLIGKGEILISLIVTGPYLRFYFFFSFKYMFHCK